MYTIVDMGVDSTIYLGTVGNTPRTEYSMHA